MNKIEVNAENYQKYLIITNNINNYLYQISNDTAVYSFPKYLKHPDYQTLVNMGDKIIPYLFHYAIQENGFSWIIMSLLSELSGVNPILPDHIGKFPHQISDWMNWFIKSKYIKTDVYYGLLDL